MGKEGNMKPPTNIEQKEAREIMERKRDECEERIGEYTRKEQQIWLDDRGYEEYTSGERCSRRFFDGMRKVMSFSLMQKVYSKTGGVARTTGEIMGFVREFYCGSNGILNLTHKRTDKTNRCDILLEKNKNVDELRGDNVLTRPQPELQSNEDKEGSKTRRKCRNVLLRAIQADGKVLNSTQKDSLSMENLFTEENVQQAIDALTCETAPGIGGWPALFYKVIGKRIDKHDTTRNILVKDQPSALAAVLAKVFITMAGKKELIPEMVDSTVSLIYKDKGKRTDMGKYRPIAVNSIIYRIMAKTIVVAIGPLLSTVTSANQKAFKPGELLSDNTRQVQDIIKYCEDAQIPGMILFADQDGAYPRVNWEYLFEVMEAMNFNPEFISLIKTMYTGVTLHFKINGVIDTNSAHPKNGIAQGCPASPCLYLLCIQGLISLLKRDQLRPNGIKGIEVPSKSTSPQHEIASVSCFADDLCLFLKDTNQLPRFKELLEVYEEGAGALNSWEKTEGMRIGSSIGETTLPTGWKEGEDIVTSSGVIRYLGIFLRNKRRSSKKMATTHN